MGLTLTAINSSLKIIKALYLQFKLVLYNIDLNLSGISLIVGQKWDIFIFLLPEMPNVAYMFKLLKLSLYFDKMFNKKYLKYMNKFPSHDTKRADPARVHWVHVHALPPPPLCPSTCTYIVLSMLKSP